MAAVAQALASPVGVFALLAALTWAPLTGFPTWPAVARGGIGGTAATTVLIGGFAYALVAGLGGRQT